MRVLIEGRVGPTVRQWRTIRDLVLLGLTLRPPEQPRAPGEELVDPQPPAGQILSLPSICHEGGWNT